jgi:hypothetical protein
MFKASINGIDSLQISRLNCKGLVERKDQCDFLTIKKKVGLADECKNKTGSIMNQYYRPRTVAKKLNIGLSSFWLYVKQNKLSTIKLSARVTVVSDSELQRFINSGGQDA